jgi:amino acid transporter
LVNNKIYMLVVILSAFWIATLINCLGIKTSSWLSIIGAIIGTILPMVFISALGISWIHSGKPSQIHFSLKTMFPNLADLNNLAFLTNILFGLMGMEMSAVHAGDVKNPQRNYPRALLFSSIIIIATLILACLAITIVVPAKQLNLVSGLIDAFAIFFNAYHMSWFIPIIAILIILGSLSGAAAWIIGPARGLYIATQDNNLPAFLQKTNRKNMPIGILLTQGVIVTLLCAVFLIMPSVNSSYWVLSNLTAQLALFFYIFMFAAALRLRYKHATVSRAYKIPGGNWGIWIVCIIGILTCIATIVIGFLPPSQVVVGKVMSYEAILISGIIIFCAPPFFIRTRSRKQTVT